ncbi:MAG: SDR family oxidoreductase [Candidatus Kapabacteria bacterium]|nr:SDR family oxidoreductase [Candidatus Kapabacteria bacterium]
MPVAWITGGARRIGKGLALRLAERGYDIAFTYNTSSEEARATKEQIESLNRTCIMMQCDVTDSAALSNVLTLFSTGLGLASVVISNAGVFPEPRALHETTNELVEDTLRVNTLPLLTIARTYQVLCQQHNHEGRLISIGSLGAEEIWKDRIAYNVSKSALQTLAHALARSMAPNITVNTVAPGAIAQPQEITENDSSLINPTRIPMQRHGTIDDVFDAVWFFATASPYITGQTITVDGGYRLVR